MSVTTKKKYVVNEALQRYQLPDEKHYIVKVRMNFTDSRKSDVDERPDSKDLRPWTNLSFDAKKFLV